MRMRCAGLVGLCFAVLLVSLTSYSLAAQDKAQKGQKAAPQKAADPKLSNIQGRVQMINKDTSTITVMVGTVPRQVVYNASTRFLYGHSDAAKPGAVAQVKQNNYISCGGTFDSKAQLMAKECVYREEK